MTGDKSSRRLVKFWWVLFATGGATGGAIAVAFLGLPNTIWGILGVGLPLGVAFGMLEWRTDRPAAAPRKPWPETKRPAPPARQTHGYKQAPRRGQLHAITRRKSAEPPSSGSS